MNSYKFSGKQFEFDNNFFRRPVKMGQIKLYQVGELACEAGFKFPEHQQICHEISFVSSGKGIMITNGIESELQQGDLYIISKDQNHSVISSIDEPLRYFYLAFEFSETEKDDILNPLDEFFAKAEKHKIKDKMNIDICFTNLMNEFFEENAYSSFLKEMYVLQIIIFTYRNFTENINRSLYLKSINSHSVGRTVYSIIRFIEDNLYEIRKINDIAESLGYSSGYLSQIFKKRTEMSLQKYINEKKMKEAVRMIKEERLSITKISEKLNYESIHSFSKAFKKTFGCSPTNYSKFFL